jgi:hypothetical protein
MEELMLPGIIIGSMGSAIAKSTLGLKNDCQSLKNAQVEYKSLKDKWGQIYSDKNELKDEFIKFNQEMATKLATLQTATSTYHNNFLKKQRLVKAAILALILSIFISFIIKKTKLIQKIVDIF